MSTQVLTDDAMSIFLRLGPGMFLVKIDIKPVFYTCPGVSAMVLVLHMLVKAIFMDA